MLLSVVIPCLNERKTIRRAVTSALKALRDAKLPDSEVIVADNGSTDGTLEVLRKMPAVRLVHVPVRGYGAALHWGILHARGAYVLFADADLSYRFSQLRRFLPAIHRQFDVVLGSRFLGEIKPGAMPWMHRYLGTPVLTRLIRWLYGLPVTDSNSGMRAIKRSFYKNMHLRNSGMEWASELLIKTAIYGGQYTEVPITLYADQRNRPPHLAAWADGWRHLKAIFLLKPNSLFVPVPLLLLAAALLHATVPLLLVLLTVAAGLTLAVIAAKLLQYAIDNRPSRLVTLTLRLPLVQVWLVAFTFILAATPYLLRSASTWLLFIWAQLVTYSIWVFFIETIKTHSLNRMPDTLLRTRPKPGHVETAATWSLDPANAPSIGQRIMSTVSWMVRGSQYRLFEQLMRPRPGDRVLDVGARPEESLSDSNFFEKRYPHPGQLTAVSIEDCKPLFDARYPKITFRQVRAGKKLPFADKQFDIVVSWATLEHVGSRDQQRFFLKELLRVGKKTFITTPDGWAPYDPHTSWFFVHWLPSGWYRALCRALGKQFWADEQHLNILSERSLKKLLPKRSGVAILKSKLFSILPAHLIVVQKGRYG